MNGTIEERSATTVKPDVTFLEDLFKDVTAGRLRIPRFQRPFVWKPDDMLSLFDSIHRGYPIGTLLLWNTSEKVQSLDTVGPLKIPRTGAAPVTYILDGQQRLSTLYGALRLPEDRPMGPDQQHWMWWIWYDLKKKEFLHISKGRPEPYMLPVRAVLRTMDFLSASRQIESDMGSDAPALIEEAEGLAQRIKSYKTAMTRIEGGTLQQAVDIFARLNTRGQSMTPDQMMSALTYNEGVGAFHLANRIDEILEKLQAFNFGAISRLAVFRSVVAAAGLDIHQTKWASLASSLRDNLPATADLAEAGLVGAAKFLSEELKIPGEKLLPYSHQMILLSEFFRLQKKVTPRQFATLRHWFWATSYSGWFAGANTTQLNDGLAEFRDFARGKATQFKTMRVSDPARPFPSSFDMRGARIRTLLLVIIQQLKPRDIDGKELDAGRLISDKGSRAFVHVFRRVKGELVSNPANRILLPPIAGSTVRAQLLGVPANLRAKVLASHGIDDEVYEALNNDDAETFILARARQLARVEREFMATIGVEPAEEEMGATDLDSESDDES
jgi:hypothetical protein